jgi:hypothetical protein
VFRGTFHVSRFTSVAIAKRKNYENSFSGEKDEMARGAGCFDRLLSSVSVWRASWRDSAGVPFS